MPLGGDADSILASLEQGLSVGLITTFDPSTCDADEDLEEVVNREELREFDYVPVTENSEVVGLLHRAAHDTEDVAGSVRDAMCNLRGDLIVSADASILTYIDGAGKNPCRLVLRGFRLNGIVTLSDLQKLPVRPVIFLLVTHLELLMTQWIREHSQTDNEWLNKLRDEDRRGKVNKKWAELQANNLAIDKLTATEFADKRDVLLELRPPEGKKKAKKELGRIERLRNSVAHAGDYALTRENAEKTVTTVRAAREWIADLQGDLKSG
jgi:hypothetical protein